MSRNLHLCKRMQERNTERLPLYRYRVTIQPSLHKRPSRNDDEFLALCIRKAARTYLHDRCRRMYMLDDKMP